MIFWLLLRARVPGRVSLLFFRFFSQEWGTQWILYCAWTSWKHGLLLFGVYAGVILYSAWTSWKHGLLLFGGLCWCNIRLLCQSAQSFMKSSGCSRCWVWVGEGSTERRGSDDALAWPPSRRFFTGLWFGHLTIFGDSAEVSMYQIHHYFPYELLES